MSNARPRSAIMTNLPKQGWTVDKEAGTGSYKDLKAVFGPDEIILTKEEDGKDIQVGVVSYGKSQMADLKDLCATAGAPFGVAKSGGGKRGGGSQLTPEQKKERQKKAAEKRKATKAGAGARKSKPEDPEPGEDESEDA